MPNRPAPKPPSPPPPAPRPPDKGLIVFTSGKERCGINEYSKGLNEQIRLAGAEVSEFTFSQTAMLNSVQEGAEVLVHFEPSLIRHGFDDQLLSAYRRKAKIVICFHYCDAALVRRYEDKADVLALHREYGIKSPKIRQVPLACPVFDPPDREALRKKFGFNKPVLTTLGFLSRWKRIPDITRLLLPAVKKRGAVLQLLCPTHYSGDTSQESAKLKQLIRGESSVVWISDFLPEQEMLERAAASDLGFVYHGENTGSCSAANKMFVSARCPLLLTSSSHDADVKHGAEHLPSFGMPAFARRAIQLIGEKGRLDALRQGMEKDYALMNQARVAQQYLDLFSEIQK